MKLLPSWEVWQRSSKRGLAFFVIPHPEPLVDHLKEKCFDYQNFRKEKKVSIKLGSSDFKIFNSCHVEPAEIQRTIRDNNLSINLTEY